MDQTTASQDVEVGLGVQGIHGDGGETGPQGRSNPLSTVFWQRETNGPRERIRQVNPHRGPAKIALGGQSCSHQSDVHQPGYTDSSVAGNNSGIEASGGEKRQEASIEAPQVQRNGNKDVRSQWV